MKAITLWNPWAHLMAVGLKTFETRKQRILYRGDICIHAGRHIACCERPLVETMLSRGLPNPNTHSFPDGCIVAVVELYDCIPTADAKKKAEVFGELPFGNYQPHRYAYLTRNLRRLLEPVPCKGMQAVHWEVPADVAQRVTEQLTEDTPFGPACCGCGPVLR